MAKGLLRCNGVAGQLGEDRACTTSEGVKRFPMLLTNGRSEHENNVIPDVDGMLGDGITALVWKHPIPIFARLTCTADAKP